MVEGANNTLYPSGTLRLPLLARGEGFALCLSEDRSAEIPSVLLPEDVDACKRTRPFADYQRYTR